MTEKKNGENEELKETVEDIEELMEKALADSKRITKQMAELETTVDNFAERYDKFFKEMPVMIGTVEQRLGKLRKVEESDTYDLKFWEGYLAALLWVSEIIKGIDAEVLDADV